MGVDVFIKKHLTPNLFGSFLVIITRNFAFYNNVASFSLYIDDLEIIYNFYQLNCYSRLTFLILVYVLSFWSNTKISLFFCNDIVSFSLCENYIFNKLYKKNLENCMKVDEHLYNNITFYDYETIRDNFKNI